ncbi:MAG: hypothetical protein IIY55_06125, partial [Blautia sp.]|nr:hypothetical protein [Blautia sp.]
MKSFQERLFKDFDVEKVEKDGKIRNVYVYKGDYASWNLEEEGRKRYRRLYAASGILICLLYLWQALQKTPMNAS